MCGYKLNGKPELDVVAVGAAAVDFMVKVNEHPRVDEIAISEDFKISPGGSTANVAFYLSKLGLKVGFVGKIGEDQYGKLIRENFEKIGINTSHLLVDRKARTASTFIAVDSRGRRVIYSLGGDPLPTSKDELDVEYLGCAKLVYVGEAFPNVVEEPLKKAKEKGVIIVYSPGGIFSSFGLNYLTPIIRLCRFMVISRRELEKLMGSKSPEASKRILELGAEAVIVTMGEKGAFIVSREGVKLVPALRVKAIDTTGAGDAFTAGFIYSFLKGNDIEKSVLFGNGLAALKVKHFGPRLESISIEMIEKIVSKHA